MCDGGEYGAGALPRRVTYRGAVPGRVPGADSGTPARSVRRYPTSVDAAGARGGSHGRRSSPPRISPGKSPPADERPAVRATGAGSDGGDGGGRGGRPTRRIDRPCEAVLSRQVTGGEHRLCPGSGWVGSTAGRFCARTCGRQYDRSISSRRTVRPRRIGRGEEPHANARPARSARRRIANTSERAGERGSGAAPRFGRVPGRRASGNRAGSCIPPAGGVRSGR